MGARISATFVSGEAEDTAAPVALSGLRVVAILTCTPEQSRRFEPDRRFTIEVAPGVTVSASCLSVRARDDGEVDIFLATTESVARSLKHLVQ